MEIFGKNMEKNSPKNPRFFPVQCSVVAVFYVSAVYPAVTAYVLYIV